ncbi:hypothetical protein AWZ03_008937 [Drosophila navojoa]|uniref:BEN domain-containing protein n=1 Tax=Drosophila navojoa TaxID=7232 RepID=A0A484B711_DRONA|nr:hypothetical protein AWZ03_008937 [Drosophila navojoa]
MCIVVTKITRTSQKKGKKKKSREKETDITIKSNKDAPIPLFAGSDVFVSKTDLAKLFVPIPPIYTSRVTDLVIGKDKLKRIALGEQQPEKETFHAIITHVCQVFARRGEKLNESNVQEYIDHKLATIKANLANSGGVMQSIKALFEDKNTCTNIQYTTTQRGRIMLIYNGYRYVVNRQSLKNVFWRCSRYVKHCCRATLVTSKVNDVTLRIAGAPHTHDPEVKADECIDVKVELSSEASATPTPVLETDACVAAFAAAYLSDDDTMAIRKPYTLPKILDGKFYKNIQPNQKTPGAIQATCTSCFGLISGTTKSTGNFLSHIKRRHKELLPLCQLYCQAKSNVSGSGSLNTKPAIHNAMSSAIEQQQPPPPPVPQAYATSTAHLSVPMPLAMPLSMPVTVQAPQMMALMHHQHHRQQPGAALPQLQAINPGHGAVYISKEY